MKTTDIRDLVEFADASPTRSTLFETPGIWSQIICLKEAQAVGPMYDPKSEGVLLVVSGEVAVQIDKSRARINQWGSVHVPAGVELNIKNASPDPSVVLLVMSPPPGAQVSGQDRQEN